jgi:ribosomal protein S18 acetylase RimI-like enzyme
MDFRPATEADIEAIATLHAESWRRSYRGSFADSYLDGDVHADRLAVWTERLTHPEPATDTVLAEEGRRLVGFVHTILDDDPRDGALLDNLHVVPDAQGTGIGTLLMGHSAAAVLARGRIRRLYLYVLELNTKAQAFYDARGGRCVGREEFDEPGGGRTIGLRYVWDDPSVLTG